MSDHIGPTPWEAIGSIVCDADSIEVCKLPVWREGRADAARLIAAAPDLLEAAEAALRYDAAIQACAADPARRPMLYRTEEDDELDTLYFNWLGRARQGIAKARGEQA